MFHKFNRRYNHTILACFVLSFFLSLFLLRGLIEDFFSYYYAGRSVLWGREMFIDVAQNKGPVMYLFYALLYGIFGLRYDLALVIASTVLDAVYCITLLFLLRTWTGYAIPKKIVHQWIIAGCCVAYVKSFTIGSTMGGVYTVQVAMTTVVLALALSEKKRWFLSGIIFALAVLTRQSVIWYGFVFVVRWWAEKRDVRALGRFLLGCMLAVAVFVWYLWWQNALVYAWENLVVSVWEHERSDGKSLVRVLFIHTRVFFSIVFTGAVVLFYRRKLYKEKLAPLMLALVVTSILSVSSVMVWGHQFLQWTPLFLFSFFWITARGLWNPLLRWIGGLTAAFAILGYGTFLYLGTWTIEGVYGTLPVPPEISQKKYMLILSAYDKPYIDWQKEAPDRYYLPFFWLNREYYGRWTDVAIARHKQLPVETLRDTAFVTFSSLDITGGYEWYFDEFSDTFQLQKQSSHTTEGIRIDVYESAL